MDLMRLYSDKITQALSVNILEAINKLHANESITLGTKEKLVTMQKTSDYEKATQLMVVLQRQLESSDNPKQLVEKYCCALVSIGDLQLRETLQTLFQQLGRF